MQDGSSTYSSSFSRYSYRYCGPYTNRLPAGRVLSITWTCISPGIWLWTPDLGVALGESDPEHHLPSFKCSILLVIESYWPGIHWLVRWLAFGGRVNVCISPILTRKVQILLPKVLHGAFGATTDIWLCDLARVTLGSDYVSTVVCRRILGSAWNHLIRKTVLLIIVILLPRFGSVKVAV